MYFLSPHGMNTQIKRGWRCSLAGYKLFNKQKTLGCQQCFSLSATHMHTLHLFLPITLLISRKKVLCYSLCYSTHLRPCGTCVRWNMELCRGAYSWKLLLDLLWLALCHLCVVLTKTSTVTINLNVKTLIWNTVFQCSGSWKQMWEWN